jgi:hypothetical protein
MRVQKWPKFPAQKARKPFSNTRREPKNIADLRRRYERVVHPASAFEAEQAKGIVTFVRCVVGEEAFRKQGEGVQLVFPLTSSLGHGEFIRGLLKVLAPKTRVVFLVTPNHGLLRGLRSEPNRSTYVAAGTNLAAQIKKALHPALRTVVIDNHDSMETYRTIVDQVMQQGKLPKNGTINAQENRVIGDYIQRFYQLGTGETRRSLRLGTSKDQDGVFAADKGNVLRHVNKQLNHSMEVVSPELTCEANFKRRMLYNLGIATAREWLKTQKK